MILQDKTWSKIDTVFKDIYEHVALSLGPEGRTVIISQDKQHPIITKDGATIAKHYKSEDPIGALVMQIIKEVCASTDLRIGDGTTVQLSSPTISISNCGIVLKRDTIIIY
jgi:chaperonin GroEL (HSP60 family)